MGNLKIACQGINGAYSNVCAKRLFPNGRIENYKSFSDVFDAVKNGECDKGVLPIENTTAGSVIETYGLLAENELYITASISMPINHCLIGLKDSRITDVKSVRSHWQALSQCSDFIEDNGYSVLTASNTAVACDELIKTNDTGIGVLAGSQCADIFGLKILKENVQNNEVNYTRFIAVSKTADFSADSDVVSMLIRFSNKPNSLCRLLRIFTEQNADLLKIQSHNIPNTKFEVEFFIDIAGHYGEKRIAELVDKIKNEAVAFSLIGAYKS